jgi:tetratricopeptide (TPR) repeat protein
MKSKKLILGLATIVFLAATAVFAANEARIFGKVVDETGEPVAGLMLKVMSPDKTTLMWETETDTKGSYRIEIDEAITPYVYQLTKKGIAPFETHLDLAVGKEQEMNFTVLSAEASKRGAPAMFNEGATAARGGDLPQAEAKFRSALELDPELAPAHAALSSILLKQQRPEEALMAAQRALELEADNEMYRGLRDTILEQEGMAAARAALEQSDPQLAAATHFKQGMELYNANNTAGAMEAFEQTINAVPEHPRSHYMLGLCLANMGQNAKAGEHLAKFLELTPEDPDAAGAQEMLDYFNSLE